MLALIPFKKTLLGLASLLLVGGGTFWALSDPGEPWVALDRSKEFVYSQVVEQVRQRLVVPPERTISIPAVEGDMSGAFRGRLLEGVRRSGSEAFAPQAGSEVAQSWLDKVQGTRLDWEALTHWFGSKEESRGGVVLLGRLAEVDNSEELSVELTWVQLDQEAKALLVPQTTTRSELQKSWWNGDYQRIRILESSRWTRLGWWLLALILPSLGATPIIKRCLKRESNFANAMMVLTGAIPGCVAGWVLTAYGSGFWGGALSFFSAACALLFSFLYCSLLEAHR